MTEQRRPDNSLDPGWKPDPSGRHELRRWSGTTWTDEVKTGDIASVDSVADAYASTRGGAPDGARRDALRREVALEVSYGANVVLQEDYLAVVARGKRPNHILHLILSVLTLGVWLIVWLIIALGGGEKRTTLRVDELGNVTKRRT